MKRTIICMIAVLMLATSLCACGGESTATPKESSAPPMLTAAPAQSTEASPAAEAETKAENPLKAEAEKLIGSDVAELIKALGEPLSFSYAPSCLGSGEDGEYIYDGFTVYTYKEGDAETVRSVE